MLRGVQPKQNQQNPAGFRRPQENAERGALDPESRTREEQAHEKPIPNPPKHLQEVHDRPAEEGAAETEKNQEHRRGPGAQISHRTIEEDGGQPAEATVFHAKLQGVLGLGEGRGHFGLPAE